MRDLPVAAASGLVRHDRHLYVVADDLPVVFVQPEEGGEEEEIRLSGEEIPEDPEERKRLKADLESLALLPDGRLVTLGSGSTELRDRGWRWHPGGRPE